MDAQDPNDPPTAAAAPPQTPEAGPTSWPLRLGWVLLLSGALSLPVILREMAATIGAAGDSGDMRQMNLAVRMGLAIWLVWGSFDLLRRRAAAIRSLRGWATIRILLLFITALHATTGGFGARAAGGASRDWASGGALATAFAVWMSVILPIFVLAWIGRDEIKDEVAKWT